MTSLGSLPMGDLSVADPARAELISRGKAVLLRHRMRAEGGLGLNDNRTNAGGASGATYDQGSAAAFLSRALDGTSREESDAAGAGGREPSAVALLELATCLQSLLGEGEASDVRVLAERLTPQVTALRPTALAPSKPP